MANDDVVYRCKAPFAYFVERLPRSVAAGVLVSATDPAYKANPDAFESVTLHVEAKRQRVEQATAAPGEVRSTPIPKPIPKAGSSKSAGE